LNQTIENIFGKVNMTEEEVDKIAYSVDASHIEGRPDMIVLPTSIEQVHKLVNVAKRIDINLVPRGAGTGLVGGTIGKGSIIVDMSKMNKIIDIGEEYVTVQAGVVVDELNRKLKAKGKVFPVIPGSSKVCTIGGMIATNAAGRQTTQGNMEDWVEELEVVDGTGKYLKIKRDIIKNFCGMEGITGIILAAKLRIIKDISKSTISILSFNTMTVLMENVKELMEDNRVRSIEYLDDLCSDYIGFEDKLHIIVEYEGEGGEIEDIEEINEVYGLRYKLSVQLKSAKFVVSEDPHVPIEEMDKFLHWLRKKNIPTFGHLGRCVIHPHFKEGSEKRAEMYDILKKLKGKAGGEHGFGLVKKEFIDEEALKRRMVIKSQYDPKNIMNRGKLV